MYIVKREEKDNKNRFSKEKKNWKFNNYFIKKKQ